jgi:hypothetical protein
MCEAWGELGVVCVLGDYVRGTSGVDQQGAGVGLQGSMPGVCLE